MIKSIKSYFTLKLVHYLFRDVVDGSSVYLYIDCYGEYWMKDSRWSLFRVRADYTPETRAQCERWRQS